MCDLPQQAFAYIDGKDIIDGGGYVGDSALLFEQMFKKSKIHVFEPLAQNYAVLQENLERYGKTGSVIPRSEGLAEHGGELELLVHGDRPDAGASFTADNLMVTLTSTQICKVISIDELCQRENLNIGLIKLDVEGPESAAIRGALNPLKEQRPVLAISICHNPEQFFLLKPYLESLNLGYWFMVRRSDFVNPMGSQILIAYPEELF